MLTGSESGKAFSLVEIVMALGIFAFAIIGVVFLLGTGLTASRETQLDSALSSALTTAAALLRSGPAPLVPTTYYFDLQGSRVTNTGSAHYALTATLLASNGLSSNVNLYTVKATAPYPSTNSVGTFLISRPK